MSILWTPSTKTSLANACQTLYDVVIVGGGVSGAILAYELGRKGKQVLVVEAGPGEDLTLNGYEDYLDRFYGAASKDNQSPYPKNPNADFPRSGDIRRPAPGQPETSGYLVQPGPYITDTTYTRVLGGTSMHWEAKTPRMLPEDFNLGSKLGRGPDWPLEYSDLEPDYRRAERELGVAGEVADQLEREVMYPKDYVFPMKGLPLSYLDQQVDKGVRGTSVELEGVKYPLEVRAYPQARNSIPNPAYNGGKGFVPVGAVSTHQVELGERCQGNNNCVPICPVQAKYHSGKTFAKALLTGNVVLLPKTVASRVNIDPETGRVSSVEVKQYHAIHEPAHETGTVRGRLFVLSAGAIETARLLLASNLKSSSGLVGRNLMDHAYLLSWAQMPQICGTMRGTVCTGGILSLRAGSFRRHQAAFAVDIHNDGWGWATGGAGTELALQVDDYNKFGKTLRRDLARRISSQLLLAFMIEVLPSESNRVTVDPSYTDALGNMRPVVSYSIPEYTLRGVKYARQFARTVFQRLGAEDCTSYDPADFGYIQYEGEGYAIRGGNHLAGTHIMGKDRLRSVVNSEQRSWDHDNLYLVGGGSMPTIGTANVTLTLAALTYKTARAMLARLA